MSVFITEMQPTDFKEVVQFFAEHEAGERCPFDHLDLAVLQRLTQRNATLNLVARSTSKLVGVFLCDHVAGSRVQHVIADQANETDDIRKLLLNNALRKLAARGVFKCRISMDTSAEKAGALWDELAWPTGDEFDSEAA